MEDARDISAASPMPENSNVGFKFPWRRDPLEGESTDYNQRGQWLRAAVLGANDGLVTTASLMMGVGAVKSDAKTMLMSGLAALVAGACSMAVGEFVSVETQRDVELSNLKREKEAQASENLAEGLELPNSTMSHPPPVLLRRVRSPLVISRAERKSLPNPVQAACASALAFFVGSLPPLISAAFIAEYVTRVCVVAGVSSLAMAMFGATGAYLGGCSVLKGIARVLIGGWIAMLITYGLLKLFGTTGGV